jgi:hypothetical protein
LRVGKVCVSGSEIGRLKKTASIASVKWVIGAYDGETLHVLLDDPEI